MKKKKRKVPNLTNRKKKHKKKMIMMKKRKNMECIVITPVTEAAVALAVLEAIITVVPPN